LLVRRDGDETTITRLDFESGEEDHVGKFEGRFYDLGADGRSVIVQDQNDPLCLDQLEMASGTRVSLHCATEAEGSRLGARASQDYKHHLTYTVGDQPTGAVLGILDSSTGVVRRVFQPEGYTLDARMGWLRLAEPSTITFAEFENGSGWFDKLFRLDVHSGSLSPIWKSTTELMELSYYQVEAGGKMAVIQGRVKSDGRVGRVMRY
jgi:hypothetical protein